MFAAKHALHSILPNVSLSIRCPAIVEVDVLKRRDAFCRVKVVLEVDEKILRADVYGGMLIRSVDGRVIQVCLVI